MRTAQVQSVETTTAKKTLRKKSVEKEVETPVETVAKPSKKSEKVEKKAKVEKVEKKTEPKVKAEKKTSAKADKKTEKKEAVDEEVVEVEKVEKKPKSINVKPTLSDNCGLNLSVAKVKNIISSRCINKLVDDASTEMKNARVMEEVEESDEKKAIHFSFALKDLSPTTVAFLEECHQNIVEHDHLQHSRVVLRSKEFQKHIGKYNEAKKVALAEFNKSQKTGNLFNQDKFDLTAFNKSFDPKFYSALDVNYTWKKLKNEALYEYCNTLVNKSKVRFNADSKVFITAFVEFVMRQTVYNGTKKCIEENKKIIQLSHALDEREESFDMFPFINSTNAYKNYLQFKNAPVAEDSSEEEDEVVEETVDAADSKDKKLQFRYYVAELCRDVRMELSKNDETVEDPLLSKFNQTSVSKAFKQFCSDVIIELLHIFGNMLKIEVVTRGVKTVNYAIVSALVFNSHILHNVPYENTIKFMQERFNAYNEIKAKSKETITIKEVMKA